MCTSPEDVCCKPKEENLQIQSTSDTQKPSEVKPAPTLPETPKPSQKPSKPKCSDIPGFQCLTDINVSDHFHTLLRLSKIKVYRIFLGM